MRAAQAAPDLNDPIVRHLRRDFATLRAQTTVGEALSSLRVRDLGEQIVYFYVVDADDRLVGVVPTRKLLMSPLDERISAIMSQDVVAIPEQATVLEACEYFTRHRFLAFPVTDGSGHILGVVDINLFTEETITTVEQRQAERLFQMLGVHVALGRQVPSWRSFLDRFPWLVCNMLSGLACAFIASRFELLLREVVLLAMFITVVLALGESVSMQSMSITLQGLSGRRTDARQMLWSTLREFTTSALLGFACGGIIGLTALIWRGEAVAAFAVAGSIFLSIVTACLLGVVIPTAIHMLRIDPKVAAGPIVLASADIATLLFYLNLSRVLLA